MIIALPEYRMSHYTYPGKTIAVKPKLTAFRLIKAVCKEYDIWYRMIFFRSRKNEVTEPRQVAMALSIQLLKLKDAEVAELFGGFDRTTVIFSRQTVSNRRDTEPDYKARYDSLKTRLINEYSL